MRLPRHPQPVPPIYQPELAARAVVYAVGGHDHGAHDEFDGQAPDNDPQLLLSHHARWMVTAAAGLTAVLLVGVRRR